ncbi:hypothetical protein NE865_07951 [Phthorimaea operculella]|nr:hypothetical protein NE865_07951 [Phthorimaea operculella]
MDPQTKIILDNMNKMKLEFQQYNDDLAARFTANLSSTIDEKLTPIVEENKKLKKQVVTLQAKVKSLERDVRKNNVIIHGIQETEMSYADLRSKMITILDNISKKSNMREWDEWEISDMRRIGKKSEGKSRPILISLTLLWRKIELLKNNKHFPTGIYATEDYPKDVQKKRKELKVQKKQEEQNGNIAFIRYDKLVVKPKILDEKTKESEKRKRTPSDSPSQANGNNMAKTPFKFNKTSTLGLPLKNKEDKVQYIQSLDENFRTLELSLSNTERRTNFQRHIGKSNHKVPQNK